MCYTSMAWNDPRFLDLGPSHGAWLESQEHDPSQNAWSREKGKHAMATGQELTPGQNAWLCGEEGKHATATGQELTPGTMHGHVVRKASMPWLLVKN